MSTPPSDATIALTLLLTEKVRQMDVQRDTLICRMADEEASVRKYPLRSLREIILCHSCVLDTGVLAALGEANVPLMLLDRFGEYAGGFVPAPLNNFQPRLAQMRARTDAARTLEAARQIVLAKLESMRKLCQERATPFPAEHLAQARAAASLDVLRGVEGVASRCHFDRMAAWLEGSGFAFPGRRKRPPPDPVNALLSLGYTHVLHTVQGAINTVGLDHALGFLHADYCSRPSLACDLMEPWRIEVADRFVLRSLNRHEFAPEMFETVEGGGVRLASDGRKRFYSRWLPFIHEEARSLPPFIPEVTFRQAIFAATRAFSGWLRGELAEWQPIAVP